MNKFKTYTEYTKFLNENIELNLVKDANSQFVSIFKTAKKKKILKNEYSESYISSNMISIFKKAPDLKKDKITYKTADGNIVRYVMSQVFCRTASNKIYYFYLLVHNAFRADEINMNTLTIAILGEDPNKELSSEDLKEIKLILPDKITSNLGGTGGKPGNVRVFSNPKIYNTFLHKTSKLNGCVFDYSVQNIEGEKVTSEIVIETEAYKDLLKELQCIKLISSSKQLKNGTILFGIHKGYVLDKEQKYTSKAGAYMYKGIALTNRGYIRSMATYDDPSFGGYNDQGSIIGSFNSSNIKGWEDGIEKIKNYIKKLVVNMKKEGIFIFTTPEELHANRGKILGTKFGL